MYCIVKTAILTSNEFMNKCLSKDVLKGFFILVKLIRPPTFVLLCDLYKKVQGSHKATTKSEFLRPSRGIQN